MYSGHKNPLIYFLPNCYSSQVVYRTGLALSTPEAQSRGRTWKDSSAQQRWIRWVLGNKSTKNAIASWTPMVFSGGKCCTELFRCKLVFLLNRTRLL